jgi:taurine---2-oxoglutarate transaminase
MGYDDLVDQTKAHSFFSWSAQGAINPIPMVRAEGACFWDANGKRYLDMNSQAMCVNIGHGDSRVIDAIKAQADELVYAAPAMATRIRAEAGRVLAEVTPGDLKHFFFTLGGADANENAIRLARGFTGRHKIITRYRSYHGATAGAISLTGDPRRWANEPGIPGIVRVFDPDKYRSPLYREGDTDAAFAGRCLDQIEEVITYEGAHTIAGILIETITGTNGVIIPPDGYLQGLRQICDRHGILLICDEVMSGFGRAGEWFAVDHWGVVPDLITMAKGLTSAYLPLGAVAISGRLNQFYQDKVYSGGLTYHAHPLCLAAAVATIKVMQADGLVDRSRRLGSLMAELLAGLQARHPSVGDVRSLGLFGIVELVRNRKTKEPLAPFNGTSPEMARLNAAFRQAGVYTHFHWNNFFTIPPLCITEDELREAFAAMDQALWIADEAARD